MGEWTVPIQRHASLSTAFPVHIFDAARALSELFMLTTLSCLVGKEQGAAEALSPRATGVVKLRGRLHAQAKRTDGGAISVSLVDGMAMPTSAARPRCRHGAAPPHA